MHSPEDVAWADSCFIEDPDMSDTNWDSLKDALFEALTMQHDPSPYEREGSPEVADMDAIQTTANDINHEEEKTVVDAGLNFPKYVSIETLDTQFQSDDINITPFQNPPMLEEILSSEGGNDIQNPAKSRISIASTSNAAEPSFNRNEDADSFWSKHKKEDVFLPAYDESFLDLGVPPDTEFVFQDSKLEQSTEDLFKIWDFDTPVEESDLIEKLNKALAINPVQPGTPFLDDSEEQKGLKDGSVDDLISGIAELTLSSKTDQRLLT